MTDPTTPAAEPVLKPCPRCRQTDMLLIHENNWCEPPEWSIWCRRCRTVPALSREEAIAAWNRRAPAPPAGAGIDREKLWEILERLEWSTKREAVIAVREELRKFLNAPEMFREAALGPQVPAGADGNRPISWTRDQLGRFVREAWVRWAETQPSPKPSWLVPYDDLADADKEADRQIGEAVARWVIIGDAASTALRAPLPPAGAFDVEAEAEELLERIRDHHQEFEIFGSVEFYDSATSIAAALLRRALASRDAEVERLERALARETNHRDELVQAIKNGTAKVLPGGVVEVPIIVRAALTPAPAPEDPSHG